MAAVKFSELEDAYEYVSFDAMFDNRAYVCRETGKIYWVSEDEDDDDEEEEEKEEDGGENKLPADLGISDRYAEVPNKRDLDLGQVLVREFMDQRMPDDYDHVDRIFRKRGAYGRFKDFLDSKGQLEAWYAFENEATRKALREWCEENGLEVIEEAPED